MRACGESRSLCQSVLPCCGGDDVRSLHGGRSSAVCVFAKQKRKERGAGAQQACLCMFVLRMASRLGP